jgi:glutathione S-transferase
MELATHILDAVPAKLAESTSTDVSNAHGRTALPVLWHFTVSHFNEKVRWALDFKRIARVRRSLLPGAHFLKVWSLTGQTALPVLELDGRPIHDSTRIIEALERAYPQRPLYPRSELERRRAVELEDFFDAELGPSMRAMLVHAQFVHAPKLTAALFTVGMGRASRSTLRMFAPMFRPLYRLRYGINATTAELARKKTFAALDRIAREIQPSGYLVGDGFTVADLTAAAFFYPLVQPPQFPYPWPRPLPAWLEEYRASLGGHAAFRWVGEMYDRHRGTSAEVVAMSTEVVE